MARIASLCIVALLSGANVASSQSWSAEVVDKESIDAFKAYWEAFDEYEKQSVAAGREKYQQAWAEVKKEYQKERKEVAAQELSALRRAADKYRKHLGSHSDATNRPFVLLDMAQVLNLIGDHLQAEDVNASLFAKAEALTVLDELIRSYPDFGHHEKAGYVRALVLGSLDRPEDAHKAWQQLVRAGGETIYSVHAYIAVGDYWFDQEKTDFALRAYRSARELLGRIEFSSKAFEAVRINYRIAWAAYRAGELSQVIEAAVALLTPGQAVESMDRRAKFQLDAIELLGDSLYENNTFADTQAVLRRKEIFRFAPAVGLKTVKRYSAQGIHNEAVKIGAFLNREFPLAAQMPDVLVVTADSYEKLGKASNRIEYLEKLSVFLPDRSLWRSQHKNDFDVIKRMESLALPAAAVTADWHYEAGRSTGNPRTAMAAAAIYEILIAFSANGDDANKWRLRLADCHFMAGRLEEASLMYRALKTRFQVDVNILQAASFELVRVDEKRWRDEYARIVEMGGDPKRELQVTQSLANLERSIDEYATRFPQEKRSIDLLLVGASAYRDMENYEQASRYWQRVLVSQPDAAQRGVAVRGLVMSSMKLGSAGDVVDVTRRFLKLEDWRALGLNIGDELKGVLAVAALDEGNRLNASGHVREAGAMLTEIANEFADLPNRDRIFRDGAYMLAISGDWSGSQVAATQYLATNLKENRGDMLYLLARSQQYQLRLGAAAKSYLQVGIDHSKHSRARVSLERAESLAQAEGLYSLAAAAAAQLAESTTDSADRMRHYAAAIDHLANANDPAQALSIARRRLRSARLPSEKFDAQLLVALATYRMGPSYEQEALDDLAVLSRNLERARSQLKEHEYAGLAGQVYFLLAEEERRRFDDFKVAARNGPEGTNVNTKMSYFKEMAALYDKSAAAGSHVWSPRSRYLLGRAAEQFADEVSALDAKRGGGRQYRTTAERLRSLAKKHYSTNVLDGKKEPHRFESNEWVQKSVSRLRSFDKSDNKQGFSEIIPQAISPDLPSAWSL